MPADRELRILLLEDSSIDARLIEREIARGGLRFALRRVASREDFVRAMGEFAPDLILADHSLPGFDGFQALEIARRRGAEAPFIFVSGTIGEETAIEAMRQGATDYVLKDRLERLGPVLRRALDEARKRRELRETERQLRQYQKMEALGRVVGGVAHDFNNILTAILGYAAIMNRNLDSVEQVKKGVEGIHRAAERGAGLTRQLLAFSRGQSLEPRVLDPGRVIAGVEGMLRRLLGEHVNLVVKTEPAGGILADLGQVELVLLNLCINARDAMEGTGGGTILIETAQSELDERRARGLPGAAPGRYVRISVSDTGCGMTPEVQAHLFEPFFSTKEPGRGTGLGLATVYGIVRQMGGHIEVSTRPGAGTRFDLHLPRVELAPEAAGAAAPAVLFTPGSETILLVEDEKDVRGLMTEILRSQGYRILEAGDPEEALARASAHAGEIDLVLTDVVMPVLPGPELVRKLLGVRPALGILFVSGYVDPNLVPAELLERGAMFLQKPFSPSSLVLKVREVLAARARTSEGARETTSGR